jgi:SAM-dependent methyltransferase
VAVDEDDTRLDVLRVRARSYPMRLDVCTGDALKVLAASGHDYDVVAAVSFLHHVPDYSALVASALDALRPGGVFLSFQDPLLHASLGPLTRCYSRVAYLAWRAGQGDLRRGAARYLRRRTRGYSATLPEDAEEFHAQRSGVDHRLLLQTFTARGADVRLILYFSTQSASFQRFGAALGLHNTFALIGGPVG